METARLSSNRWNSGAISIVLWDVFANASVDKDPLRQCARSLLNYQVNTDHQSNWLTDEAAADVLRGVSEGRIIPQIRYEVCGHEELPELFRGDPFDLVYSQACLEHAWHIQETWDSLFEVTAPLGWHSHRIDLADHGSRDTNYIEMLEWPEWAYWLTMRFIPGAINRWRAQDHLAYLNNNGFSILHESRDIQHSLPVKRHKLAEPHRNMDETELKTTAIDVVARHRS